ncbi:MAG: ABC transporter ATP-binding protein [Acidimicrobiia bacterium]|nr:ABC transporter ATP-binding protein [Acidimicrobiia bacterium]MDH3463414.1 ABC transporter ATP-binding protein [Acidimicrobiia bacterium]
MTSATDQLSIRARGLTKSYGDTLALDGFSLDVWEGTVVTLLGPSGCGKTTALRVIAGFERAEGVVEIRGRTVLGPDTFIPPEQRRVGMVFQDYALFPHMTVRKNVRYGLGKGSRPERVDEIIELVGLHGLADRMPNELSGGQQQRVALARALAPGPDVILLDEPFSNLDAALREKVRRELKLILTEARTTAVFVTHDQEEALATSDLVAVMKNGRILQADTPGHLYSNPATEWVATFLGDADVLDSEARAGLVETILGTFETDVTGPVSVVVRPENVQMSVGETANATVAGIEFFGHDQLVTLAMAGGVRVRSRVGSRPAYRIGQHLRARAIDARIFTRPGPDPGHR